MTQLVSLGQAARNALAKYLLDELAPVAGGDGVVVQPRWFEKDREHPPRSITIISAGPPETDWTDPEVIDASDNGDSRTDATWALGYRSYPLQLDVWAPNDVELDDIVARVERALNAGQKPYNESLEPTPVTNNDPFGLGVLLPLADGWEPGTVDFLFDAPDADPSSGQVLEGEWRAMVRGVANVRLVQKATSPRMARINFQQRLRTAEPVDTAADYDTTTLEADG